jgi:hypothetical protein
LTFFQNEEKQKNSPSYTNKNLWSIYFYNRYLLDNDSFSLFSFQKKKDRFICNLIKSPFTYDVFFPDRL